MALEVVRQHADRARRPVTSCSVLASSAPRTEFGSISLLALSSVSRPCRACRARSPGSDRARAIVFRKSSPISLRGISSIFLMMLVGARLDHRELAGDGRQLHRLLRPVDRRRRGIGEEVEGDEEGAGQEVAAAQLRAHAVRDQVVDQRRGAGREVRRRAAVEICTPSRVGIQADRHRRRELEGLRRRPARGCPPPRRSECRGTPRARRARGRGPFA